MKKSMFFLHVVTALFVAVLSLNGLSAQESSLTTLDRVLDTAQSYVDTKQKYIAGIEEMLLDEELSPNQRYNIYDKLYEEYFAFQFDKAREALDQRHSLAVEMGDRAMISDVNIDRAMLYTISGMFFEADELLVNTIDTMHLSREQRIDYYNVQQRFHSDFLHYTGDSEARSRSAHLKTYYRERILALTEPVHPLHLYITIRNLVDAGEWAEAASLNHELLSSVKPDTHLFAMYAYDQARISEALDMEAEMIEWFALSAIADIRTATKDNASLCSLAQVLLSHNDIDRAFRYITISLNDALFYNAKLRPWQISGVMPEIERAYHAKQGEQNERLMHQEEHSRRLALIISVLAVALMCICGYMATLLVRSRRTSRQIHQMNEHIAGSNAELKNLNERLAAINLELREANTVKEEYIALFLSMCSDYIEKLSMLQRNTRRKLSQGKVAELEKELSSSSIMDEELENFYNMFDNAFLSLYPNFVEEFNALLKPDAKIELKRGERLNTELRIFALIRLGISDSSRIAALLRYSVNTIYNYRARTKNNAIGVRDDFEEQIKRIGR